jgi:DNA-binding MarR family transcriptional regulator
MVTNPNIIDLESSIGPWLGKTVKMVDYYVQESFKENNIDLTKEQAIILKVLSEKGSQNQNELACSTFRDKSSLARLLSTMENKKYIVRKPDKDDKRINNVSITKLGESINHKSLPLIKEVVTTMQQNISEKDIKNTIKILQKIQSNLTTEVHSF